MKLLRHVSKYVFIRAGLGSVCMDGYRTPYRVYRRKLPFIYKYFGTCWLAHWDSPKDIEEWIKSKEDK